jgi:hypothetical protein
LAPNSNILFKTADSSITGATATGATSTTALSITGVVSFTAATFLARGALAGVDATEAEGVAVAVAVETFLAALTILGNIQYNMTSF